MSFFSFPIYKFSIDKNKTFGYIFGFIILFIGLFLHFNNKNNVILNKTITKIISNDGKICDKHIDIYASRYNVSVSNKYSCVIFVNHNGINYPIQVKNSSTQYRVGENVEVYYNKNDVKKKLNIYSGNGSIYFLIFSIIVLLFVHFGSTNTKYHNDYTRYNYPIIHLADPVYDAYGITYSVS